MDALLNCVLQIYRSAQDTSIDEFQRTMPAILQQAIPFRSAAWCSDAGVGVDSEPLSIRGLEAFNEPEDLLKDMPAINGKASNSKQVAFITRIARRPRVASIGFAPALYASRNDTELREYIRRYGHEHNLIIADIETPKSRGTWLSLYRPAAWDAFHAKHAHALTLVMPHIVEARAINRRLSLGQAGLESWSSGGMRALIKNNGTIIHAGNRFRELVEDHWSGATRTRLPTALVSELRRTGSVVNGRVRIDRSPFGELQMLSLSELSLALRLSPREYEVAQIYSDGKSYKEISRALGISPVTVRNLIQQIYRKLGINNKAGLVRALLNDELARPLLSRLS